MTLPRPLPFLLTLTLAALLLTACDDAVEISEGDIAYSGLPQLSVTTPDGVGIKRQYIEHSTLRVSHGDNLESLSGEIMIKGRGNTSWIFPKKPYSLRLTGGQSLKEPSDTTWVLLANYDDKTLVRNELALYMGRKLSTLDYTPQSYLADFSLNSLYQGIYLFCQGVTVGPSRVDVGEDGFLLEVDGKSRYHETIFNTIRLTHPLNIHYPEVMEGSPDYHYIKAYVQAAEDALFSTQFTDETEGYRRYMDMESFAEWYVVNEIAKNADAAFFTSCFMHCRRGGRLTMGPLWDFSCAFGGYKDNEFGRTVANVPEGFYIRRTKWFGRLFDDPAFRACVKERFNHYYAHRALLYAHIDASCSQIADKLVYENRLWGQLCKPSASEKQVRQEHQAQAAYLKEWLETRMNWLKGEFDAMH